MKKAVLALAIVFGMALAFGTSAWATTKTVTYTMNYGMQSGSNYYVSLDMSGDTPFDGTTNIGSQLFSNRTSAFFTLADGFTFNFVWGNVTSLQSSALGFCHSNVNLQYTVNWNFLNVTNGNNYYVTNVQLTDVNGNPMNLEGGGTATVDYNYNEQRSITFTAAKGPSNNNSTGFFKKLVITYTDAPALSIFNQLNDGSYQIQQMFDLRHLADYVNRGQNNCSGLTFSQTSNIDCNNTCTPIGHKVGNYDLVPFAGTYDGRGYIISDMSYSCGNSSDAGKNIGLFGTIENGTVKNVVVASSTFQGYQNVGGIVGHNQSGYIQNCRVESSVAVKAGTTNANYLGGIAGQSSGSSSPSRVVGCISAASVTHEGWTGTESFGGIVGYLDGGWVNDCLYTGTNISVHNAYSNDSKRKGAIIGYRRFGTYTNNYYTNINLGGVNGSDVDGARRARTVTLNGNAALSGNETAYDVSNLTAIAPTNSGATALRHGSTTYSGSTQKLYLTYNGTVPTGYNLSFSASAGTLNGNTLTMPDSNVTISVTLILITYNITYELNGGSVATANPTTYNIETEAFTLNNPTKPNYDFAGWTGTGLNEPTMTVTIAQGSTGNRSYIATWAPTNYTITYELNGGSVATANPITYNIETPTFTLYNPTKPNYGFLGWTGTDLIEPTLSVTIAQGSTGDRSYSATWTDVWGIADGANGTEQYPYIITTTTDLDLLSSEVNGGNNFYEKFFKLGADIAYDPTKLDANGENYTAIGGVFNSSMRSFMGTFDGDGHTVSGIRINKDGNHYNTDEYLGLFGRVTYSIVKNVTLSDAVITGYREVGGIVGYFDSSIIQNCHVTGSVTLHAIQNNAYDFGGIVGTNNIGTISDCTSAASLTVADGLSGCRFFGGLVGNNGGHMQNCLVMGATIPTLHYSNQNNDYDASGAIAGWHNNNYSLSHNYYHGVTIAGVTTGIGVGYKSHSYVRHDITENDGARSIHTLTFGADLSGSATVAINHNNTDYYTAGTEVTVSYSETVPESYMLSYSYNDGHDNHAFNGNSFEMPAADVTVIAIFTPDIATWWHADADHDGTSAERAYIITTTTGLNLLVSEVNGGNNFYLLYFKLGADIAYDPTNLDTNGENYTAIGGIFNSSMLSFSGTFDGDYHTVSGIRINKDGNQYNTDEYLGLFGCVTLGTVKNVILSDAVITGYGEVGGIVGFIEQGTVQNCHVTGTVTLHAVQNNAYSFGGIAGANDRGTISGCTSAASLTVADGLGDCIYFGGLVGNNGGNIQNCLVMGATIPTLHYSNQNNDFDASGAIAGWHNNNYSLSHNYYHGVTIAGATTGIGVGYNPNSYVRHDITENDGAVPATAVSRTITGYGDSTESDHWAFIASPMDCVMTPHHVQGLMTTPAEHYDLYRFNQDADLEWQNYKAHTGDFNIENGKGYLYASKEDVTLTFLGTPNSDDAVNVSLSYTEGKPLAGFNLVGNPFAENATLNKSYYSMNAAGTGLVATAADGSTPIAPCTGVIVQATEANQSVTISKVTRGETSTGNGSLNISLGQAQGTMIDNAIVSFDEGSQLNKFYFGEQNANIYILQDGKEYAIVSAEAKGEVPVNFKAKENGEYTLTVSSTLYSLLLTLSSLHLIDNLAGADIDLLQTPSYTFTARNDDYASRFKLVFNVQQGGEAAEEDFAFISNGELIVNGTGTLQVIDALGRELVCKKLSPLTSHLSLLTFKPGVYVLRLINGERVKTQKIVIR